MTFSIHNSIRVARTSQTPSQIAQQDAVKQEYSETMIQEEVSLSGGAAQERSAALCRIGTQHSSLR